MIEKTYTEMMDKIYIDETRKDEIRTCIINNEPAPKRKVYTYVGRFAIAAAVLIAIIMAIPSSRTAVLAAADYVAKTFNFANGSEYSIATTDSSTKFTIVTDSPDYIEERDGRLYFIFDDLNKDITSEVSETDYFRYEKKLDSGKSVILVGGTPGAYGWVELSFDESGEYIMDRMNVPSRGEDWKPGGEPDWVDIGMHNEGVSTGNPSLDSQLDD